MRETKRDRERETERDRERQRETEKDRERETKRVRKRETEKDRERKIPLTWSAIEVDIAGDHVVKDGLVHKIVHREGVEPPVYRIPRSEIRI